MPISRSVAEQPVISLEDWVIARGDDGQAFFSFVGVDTGSGIMRMSTDIMHFDPDAKTGKTASGRTYELVGESRVISRFVNDTEVMIGQFCARYRIPRDAVEMVSVDVLAAAVPREMTWSPGP